MRIFHKSEQEVSTIHEITNIDWENQIDQIYRKIVSVHSSAYCLATNTIRNNVDDSSGTILDEIVFRFKIDSHIVRHLLSGASISPQYGSNVIEKSLAKINRR